MLANLAEQAARLAKADLVTEMVGEFPELQGLMGGYYARAEGLPDEVADAIRDHYKPVGQGDEVPTAPVTVAVSLADKLDTLLSFFAVDERPTGSKDPFAIRRAAIAICELLFVNEIRLPLRLAIGRSYEGLRRKIVSRELTVRYDEEDHAHRVLWQHSHCDPEWQIAVLEEPPQGVSPIDEEGEYFDGNVFTLSNYLRFVLPPTSQLVGDTIKFLADRLKVQQREAGVRHDLIDAVFALGGEDDLVRLLARVKALQSFIATPDGANLLAGYKRAANILKKEDWQGIEGEIAQTGEEDPLSEVDDPDLAAVVAAKMAERHAKVLSYTPEKAEAALIDALATAGPKADTAIAAEDFEGAMAALASLRAPIDTFFDEVTVNDEDKEKRAARLELLAQFRAAVHKVADFSKIEG
jgi:glycyl-tRNA synthetase beta chain